MSLNYLRFLQWMQLTDSALPIGSAAHSFGLETLVAEGYLTVERLQPFLQDYMEETGGWESAFCRLGYRLTSLCDLDAFETSWRMLNEQLSACKMARESRVASATLGRRFLQLAQNLEERPLLQRAIQAAKTCGVESHYCTVFGLVGGLLGIDETMTALSYLQQSLTALVSACQRLLPLGQTQASAIVWQLKPALIDIARRSEVQDLSVGALTIFTPLSDVASMRHPSLTTRLFIS